jgi:hypothetical protein
MRTTLTIDDDLLQEAKERAARAGVSVSQLVEEAIRYAFAHKVAQKGYVSTSLPTADGQPRPGIDLDNNAALLDVMEQAT